MKNIIKAVLYLEMTALLLAAALPNCSAAGKELPFHGSIQGMEIADIQFPKILVDGSGSGTGTHLGRFNFSYELEVDLLTMPFETFGTGVFTAANGDRVFTDIIGRGTPLDDANIVSVREEHAITGGTGRFSGVTGSFVRTYLLNRTSGATFGSFSGTIVIH